MTGADVVVDPHDDVATTRAIHRLAAAQPAVLVASIPPDERTVSAVVWAILRALGKRTAKLARSSPDWHHARTWLQAHLISELIVLRAQHLKPGSEQALAQLANDASSTLTLVYSGRDVTNRRPTLTLNQLLNRPRTPRQPEIRTSSWPEIPRSHPWRLRHDCAHALSLDDFYRVDALIYATHRTLEHWLLRRPGHTPDQLRRAVSIMRIADDPNQCHLRNCAITVLLHSLGVAVPRPAVPPFRPRALSQSQIDQALAHTNCASAGYILAEQFTGLPPDLLALVGGDQMTENSILGRRVPDRARPILRALSPGTYPGLSPPPGARPQPTQTTNRASVLSPGETLDTELAAAIEPLMSGRRPFIRAADLSARVRDQFDDLHAKHVLDRRNDVYRASDIALYALYLLPSPPSRALTDEWDDPLTSTGNPADIWVGIHSRRRSHVCPLLARILIRYTSRKPRSYRESGSCGRRSDRRLP
jgi:hypothetical protein